MWFIIAVMAAAALIRLRPTIIADHEQAALYRHGRFVATLPPGRHRCLWLGETLCRFDTRLAALTLPGQEILTADGVSLKVSLAATYRLADGALALRELQDHRAWLYQALQIALREQVGRLSLDALAAAREQLGADITERVAAQAANVGIDLASASVRDVMLPAKLRDRLAQAAVARQEALAGLERARGETAALRHLANVSDLLASHPSLLRLRALQAAESSEGGSLVLHLDGER